MQREQLRSGTAGDGVQNSLTHQNVSFIASDHESGTNRVYRMRQQWLVATDVCYFGCHVRLLEGMGAHTEPKRRAWRHGRAWKMKIRAWKNQDPCFNFYKHIYVLLGLHKYPV